MQQNVKVESIYKIGQPLLMNKFFFKSCYYHDLIAALGCLQVNGLKLLQNQKLRVKEDFEVEDGWYLNEKIFEEKMGYHIESLNLNKEVLLRYIRSDKPLIVGVDCYYIKERREEYLKQHCKHFIMVYGYDLNRNVLNIVDHNYFNSLMFEEKEMEIDSLLEYNQKYYERYCNQETPYSSKAVVQDVPFVEFDIAKLCTAEENSNVNNAVKNLQLITAFLEGEEKLSADNFNKIDKYLLSIQRYKQTRLYAEAQLAPQKEILLNKLVGGYALLLGLLRKIYLKKDFLPLGQARERYLAKIDEVVMLEKEFNELYGGN
jgi:hypothetical protein